MLWESNLHPDGVIQPDGKGVLFILQFIVTRNVVIRLCDMLTPIIIM